MTDMAHAARFDDMHRPSPTLALIAGGAIATFAVLWQPGISVVDGDTVEHGFWRWRLVGLDAPETRGARCAEERALGERAAARLRSLVAGGGAVLVPVFTRPPYCRRQ
jgi:endonuclease YncB( thermonuclease family)